MANTSSRSSWLGAALAVALLWAPLPGMAAIWYAAQAEDARTDEETFHKRASQARLWVGLSVAFGFIQVSGLFGFRALRTLLAGLQ